MTSYIGLHVRPVIDTVFTAVIAAPGSSLLAVFAGVSFTYCAGTVIFSRCFTGASMMLVALALHSAIARATSSCTHTCTCANHMLASSGGFAWFMTAGITVSASSAGLGPLGCCTADPM